MAGGFSCLITFEPDVVSAAIIYVGSGFGNDTTSIQEAIDNYASDGDTVFVYCGTYYENVVINKTIDLIGENKDTTIIDASGNSDAIFGSANYINITGFSIRNSGQNPSDAGIKLYFAQCCSIANNNVLNNFIGMNLYYSDNTTIVNNNASNNWIGISLDHSNSSTIANNKALSNIYFGIRLYRSNNNTFFNNVASHNFEMGTFLFESNNNSITYNNASNSRYGFFISTSNNNFIANNNASLNHLDGIRLTKSNWNTITNNTVSNNNYGILLDSSMGTIITNNVMCKNGIFISGGLVHWNTHTIDTSNTVNGKPLYYWKNVIGGNIPPNAGQVVLANSTGVVIENQNVSHSSVGILLGFSSNNVIINNNASRNWCMIELFSSDKNVISNNDVSNNWIGISLHSSKGNSITNNDVCSNDRRGIYLSSSSDNIIANNNVSSNLRYGIYIDTSTNNTVSENNALQSWYAIYLLTSNDNKITNNNVNSNVEAGIRIDFSSNNNITNNNISNNVGDGIFLGCSSNNTIAGNSIYSNTDNGVHLYYYSLKNEIVDCNIFDNNRATYIRDFSNDNSIINSTIVDNSYCGIEIYNGAHNNYIKNGYITSNNIAGIIIQEASDNKILDSYIFSHTEFGIHLTLSSNNTITNCNIFLNDDGIFLNSSFGNNIIYNYVSLNDRYGIGLSSGSNKNKITNNSLLNNGFFGFYIMLGSLNNRIYHNNIIDNTNQAYDDTNNGNQWDNDYPSGGNYWSDFDEPSEGAYDDYQGLDQNVIGRDGIVDNGSDAGGGKNPYVIDANSRDNYPFIDYIGEQVLRPLQPTLYINISSDERDVVLFWDPPTSPDIEYYLIYRSVSQTAFNFSTIWVNTSSNMEPGESVPIPLRTMWNDTNAAFPGNETNYKEQYYYIIRAVNDVGEVSRTSRTVGKWTKEFPKGISTFSLPLEPIDILYTDNLTSSMKADYIKYINITTNKWMTHNFGDSNTNNTQMRLGEGYEVKFSSKINYTFTGMPGAMISYDNDTGFLGFDHNTEAKSLEVTVDINGNVNLTWQGPLSVGQGDKYEIYFSNKRDGFFGTFGIDYFPACPIVNFGINTAIHSGTLTNDLGTRLYYMVVPFNASGVRGSSTYSIAVWTEEYLQGYDTFGIPLKLSSNQTMDWYCEKIPHSVGMNYYNIDVQRWYWHSTRMPAGAYDPMLEMTEGYQISTSGPTKFIFIGI
ncbi:MAG: right-handed parallel beta-helix repeat-containing protein [Thermoplasmata archaeon]|nr:MAG: right-handed parallel beta-helix repeat-containing protein [Thermoplasmata archaeon]